MSREIINPDFTTVYVPEMGGINMVQCNKSGEVRKFIRTGTHYVIELPDTQTILNVECSGTGINAADMKIVSAFINSKRSLDDEDYVFSYQYEHFDAIHYTSFNYREKCKVYISVNDLF
jgi:hypothetical protein